MITEQELIDATLSAITNCQKTYLKWSYNEWLSYAPEYFLTEIGRASCRERV